MFSRSRNPLLTFLLSYHVWVTSKIQVNFRYRRYWWFCLVNFGNFFNIYVFEVKKSIADIPTELPCSGDLENPGQLPVQRYTKVLMIVSYKFWHFFTIYVFEVKQPNLDISTELLPCSDDLKNPGQLPVQVVLMILSYGFLKFLYYLCFRGQGIHCWYSYWTTLFGWSRKSGSTFGSRGFCGHPNKVAQ